MKTIQKHIRWHLRFVLILATVLVGGALAACGGEDDAEVVEASEPVETVEAEQPVEHSDDEGEPLEPSDPVEPEPTPTPALDDLRAEAVRAIRSLMVIETASHSVETIVEREADSGFLASDKLQLIAHGVVTAGVDLIDVSDADVEIIDFDSVRVTLPESSILEAKLDRNRTQVTNRDTGLLGSEDEELEAEAIAEAEVKILESACEHDILERAATDAEKHVMTALHGLGYIAVSVNAPAGACQ
jgi:hypothetical protein